MEPMPEWMPPELAVDHEPMTDDELEAWFDALDYDGISVTDAVNVSIGATVNELADLDDAPGRWRIESDGEAEWALRKIMVANAEQRHVIAQRDAYIDRISSWFAGQVRRSTATQTFFRAHLEAWARRRRAASGGKVKTIDLPSGKIATRESPARIAIPSGEGDALIAWLETNLPYERDVVKVTKRLVLSELAKVLPVVERRTGRVVATFDCGASVTAALLALDTPCPLGHFECAATWRDEVEHVVVDPGTGEVVDLVEVVEPTVSVTVKPSPLEQS